MEYWSFLKTQIDCDNNIYTFGRTQEVQDRYIRFKSNISNIYKHLVETLFVNDEKLVFKENDFPYKFNCEECKIKHYLLWINPKNKRKIKINNIKRFITKKILEFDYNIIDYIIFKNNIVNKSVETIDHYHILFRLK